MWVVKRRKAGGLRGVLAGTLTGGLRKLNRGSSSSGHEHCHRGEAVQNLFGHLYSAPHQRHLLHYITRCLIVAGCILPCLGLPLTVCCAGVVACQHVMCLAVLYCHCRGPWLRMRESRLTGSAVANMLCWFGGQDRGDHVRLWREKLGLQKPPPREPGLPHDIVKK